MIGAATMVGARMPHVNAAPPPSTPLLWDTASAAPDWTISEAGVRGQIVGRPPVLGWGVRGDNYKSTGKWYFEVFISVNATASAATEAVFGLADSTWVANDRGVLHSVANAWCVDRSGIAWHNSVSSSGTTFLPEYNSSPGTIMVAVDLDLGEVWFGRNGVWPLYLAVPSDPATGVLPALSSLAGSITIASVGNATVTNNIDARIRSVLADMTYTPPTGFSPWAGS